ncbi:MAG: hypothetical protein WBG46_04685 [Nonlabens sp.]
MFEQFAPRRDQEHLENIDDLLIKVIESLENLLSPSKKHQFQNTLITKCIQRLSIVRRRLCSEGYIDGILLEEIIRDLKKRDPQIGNVLIPITKGRFHRGGKLVPYNYEVLGNPS